MRSWSCWDSRFPGSKLRSRLSVTSWMLLSCLYLFVVRMLRSRRDSLILAVIFMSLHVVSQRLIDIRVEPGSSWIHWTTEYGAVGTSAGGRKSKSLSLWSFQSCSTDVWVGPGESWIQWIMGCGAVGTCAGGRKSESSGPWCFQSCSMDVRLGL